MPRRKKFFFGAAAAFGASASASHGFPGSACGSWTARFQRSIACRWPKSWTASSTFHSISAFQQQHGSPSSSPFVSPSPSESSSHSSLDQTLPSRLKSRPNALSGPPPVVMRWPTAADPGTLWPFGTSARYASNATAPVASTASTAARR